MVLRVGLPDLISPSYFPVIAAVELGFLAEEGIDAAIELVFPVQRTFEELREGRLDVVAGSAHAPLYAFDDWQGSRLLCGLSRHMYWFLVVRASLGAQPGDLAALRGLRVGAAPGPVDGLRRLLVAVGIDPDRDLDIVPVPGTAGAGVSFGVSAASALADGVLDGFWANGMGAAVAVRNGSGTLLFDARRSGTPAEARDYTFPALAATQQRIDERPDEVAAIIRAIVAAQQALRRDPTLATRAAEPHFPPTEQGLIADLIRDDAPFYAAGISRGAVAALNRFSHDLGLLADATVPYEGVVAAQFAPLWAPDAT